MENVVFSTENKEELNLHIDANHKPEITTAFKCQQCDETYPEESLLKQHISNVHVLQLFRCHLCKFVTDSNIEFKEHEKQIHDPNSDYKTCDMCSYKALHESDLRIHKNTFHDNQLFVLRAIQELTTNIKTLTTDVFHLKSNSIIIEKDVFALIKKDIVDEIIQKVNAKFGKIEDNLANVNNVLSNIKSDVVKENTKAKENDEEITIDVVVTSDEEKRTQETKKTHKEVLKGVLVPTKRVYSLIGMKRGLEQVECIYY